MLKKEQKRNINPSSTLRINNEEKAKPTTISFRLKCTKTANGLSHFVMYGDMPKKKTLL